MANTTITKGSSVEVSSDEPGFHGAWYVGTVTDTIELTTPNKKTRNSKKPGYLIKYHTLVKEDRDEPLTEAVDCRFVRPLPPPNIRRNVDRDKKEVEAEVVEGDGDGNGDGDGGGDFEVNDVVDAYHRDGWWLGVVTSVKLEGETRKYTVAFENPYEEFDFEKSKMRFHVDWVDSKWFVPPKKTPEDVLGGKNASDDADLGFTTPSNQSLITHVDNEAVGPALSAKRNSRSRKQAEANSAVDTSVTYGRNKRKLNLAEDGSGRKRLQSSTGGKGNKKAIVPVLETNGSDDSHQDSPTIEHVIDLTQTSEGEDGKSQQKRKRGRKAKSLAKKPTGSLIDGNDVTGTDELPLSVMFQGMRPFSMLKRSSCCSPPEKSSSNQALVASGAGAETTTTNNKKQDWPFIKRAPIWVAIESLELYQKPPQKPHFSPLKKIQKNCREGLAIALMVTYGNLVQGLEDLQLDDPVDIINANLETSCELETHGFDVGPIQARLNKLLELQSKVGPHKDKRNKVEKELEKCTNEKSEVEKEMDWLKAKMKELEEKTVQTAAVQKAKEEEMVKLQTNLDVVSREINDWEAAFEKLCKKALTSD